MSVHPNNPNRVFTHWTKKLKYRNSLGLEFYEGAKYFNITPFGREPAGLHEHTPMYLTDSKYNNKKICKVCRRFLKQGE